ncbi:MAG TPA: glycosyltransferase family 4 protein [Gemmatimonadota bacterium]|nr:glycosyltransferase family 4 protein [Gemmatimonadota bacterium]
MKILVVNWQDWTHPEAGGAEVHLRETFSRVAANGNRVDLLCVSHPDAPGEETLAGINVIRRGKRRATFNFAVPALWHSVLRRNAYDVVVDDLNKVPFYTPLFVDRPVVALVHHLFGATIFQETNPAFGAYLFLSERPIARVYRSVPFIAVSPSTAADLERRGVDPARITVIPNGLPPIPAEDRLLAVPKDPAPLFVYLGRLKRYKRIDLLLEGFARVALERPDARLVIAGDGDHRRALERQAAALDLGARVEFPGWVGEEEKWRLLRRAWAVGYTSPKEGWGFSSIEAQRVGTIAIVSDAPGLRDTVVEGQTGWIVPHGDVPALAAALSRAITEPELRAGMEARAIDRSGEYTWDAAARATEAVLRAAAGRT